MAGSGAALASLGQVVQALVHAGGSLIDEEALPDAGMRQRMVRAFEAVEA